MLSQWFNKMEHHLSKRPFRRPHWWSRRWVAHISIHPPLTGEAPLWKRSPVELARLRLFNLSPEALSRKIERYWKKPRWRRWFTSFGMRKKIDVWNYYQRCLAYQRALKEISLIDQGLILTGNAQDLLDELACYLQASNVKFEFYLEKHCRNLKWVEQYFLKEVRHYQQRLRKDFLLSLEKCLIYVTSEEEQTLIREKAEKEYQHIEVLMYRYYQLWQSGALYKRYHAERGIEVADVEKEENLERSVVVCPSTSAAFTPNTATPAVMSQTGISSFSVTKEWVQSRRERLECLIKEDALQDVKELLQKSLEDIKNIIDSQLEGYETTVVSIMEGNAEQEARLLRILEHLQRRLKPLLKGGLRLFHSDHVMSLSPSKAIFQLITQYSQDYLQQHRLYLEKLQVYQQRLKLSYEQRLRTQAQLQTLSELSARIDKLYQSCQDMYAKFAQDYADLEARMAQRMVEMEARWMQRIDDIALRLEMKRDAELRCVTEQEILVTDSAEKLMNRPSF